MQIKLQSPLAPFKTHFLTFNEEEYVAIWQGAEFEADSFKEALERVLAQGWVKAKK